VKSNVVDENSLDRAREIVEDGVASLLAARGVATA